MEVICALLVTAIIIIVILVSQLSYKNHCIEDLENRLSKEAERKNKNFIEILKRLKEYQKYTPAIRDTLTRRLLDEATEEYSNENSEFETLLELACEEYTKKELNTSATNENV